MIKTKESIGDDVWSLFTTFAAEEDGEIKETCVSSENDDSWCPYCKSHTVILDECNYICQQCSSLTTRYIDAGAEWRYYGADDNKQVDPTRCGMPTNDLLPNSSLGSVISSKMGESFGMKIIRKHHFWNSVTYKERTLYHIFDNISTHAINSGLPSTIIEEAKALYKKMSEVKLTRGDNRNGMIATSIYMSCKNHNVPRSSKEIASIFNIKNTTMTKGCKRFQELMQVNMDSSEPENFINRFGSRINMAPDMRELCKTVLRKADEIGVLSENTPPSIAAGIMLLVIIACKLDITKQDLSNVCGVSQVTICKCHKKLHVHRGHIFPPEVIAKYSIV
jgi:transcription initiation factor TFIIB